MGMEQLPPKNGKENMGHLDSRYIYIYKSQICSMYGILEWLKSMVNIGNYSLHGAN